MPNFITNSSTKILKKRLFELLTKSEELSLLELPKNNIFNLNEEFEGHCPSMHHKLSFHP